MFARLLFVAVALTSTQALASKARLQALGQSTDGSYYVEDTRNMFLNPARVGNTGEQISLEWGDSNRPPGATNANAEGNFTTAAGPGFLAVALGREMDLSTYARLLNDTTLVTGATVTAAFGATTFPEPKNTVEVIYGGGNTDFRWGGAVMYGQAKQDTAANTTDKAQALQLRGGVAAGLWEANARISIGDKSEFAQTTTSTVEYEGEIGVDAGGAFTLNDTSKIFANVIFDSAELSNSGNTAGLDAKFTAYQLGYAKWRPIDTSARFFYSAAFLMADVDLKGKQGAASGSIESTSLPLVAGIETDAATWLKLRGSVSQNVLIASSKRSQGTTTLKAEHTPNSTTVAAGAGLVFNKVMLDATFGGTGATGASGTLTANNLFANVSLNYNF